MSPIFRACSPLLFRAARLGTPPLEGTADTLRGTLVPALREMIARCRAEGIPDGDIAEAQYAIVAFLDDRILKSPWASRVEWANYPLQLQLYQENSAGEGFYARLDALLKRPGGSPALEIYYLCLALGFTGATRGGPGAAKVLERVRGSFPSTAPHHPLSPHGLPRDRPPRGTQRPTLFPIAITAVALLVGATLSILTVALRVATSSARDALLAEIPPTPSSSSP